MSTETAIYIAAGLATAGWLYTARRQRTLAKKQHTFNTLLKASFNNNFQDSLRIAAPHLKQNIYPEFEEGSDDSRAFNAAIRTLIEPLRVHFRRNSQRRYG